MSLVLAIKLFASPLLIGLASLAGKRWGPNAAGLFGGLPLVAAPVVFALWLADGSALATRVSLAAPAGVWATMIYLLVVGYASARLRWYGAIAVGWTCYFAAQWLLHATDAASFPLVGFAVFPGLWFAATRWLPRPVTRAAPAHLPAIELVARMVAAVALVLALTQAADALGPDDTGMLSAAPVAATVIPAFVMATAGRDALLTALRGFLTGISGFTTFFLVLGHGIPVFGALALVPATLAAAGVSYTAMRMLRRWARISVSPSFPPSG